MGRTDPETGRLSLRALAAGRHRVRLSSEGHEDVIREVEIAGESVAVEALLPRRPVAPPRAPAETDPLPKPRVALGSVVGIVVGLILLIGLLIRSVVRQPVGPAVSEETPTFVGGRGDPGTDEVFPMPFGDYSLVRRIGKGGMAVVYEAVRRGETLALKRPLAGFLDDDRFRERFLREAELGRTLHHPNIIRIFDRGQVGETPYFAMELLRGETLAARLDREGRLDVAQAARLTAQVAEALDYAHNKGVIHRDLKPSNIMIDPSGAVKVMDYGIARAQHMEGTDHDRRVSGHSQLRGPRDRGGRQPAGQRRLFAGRGPLRDADRQPALPGGHRLRGAAQPLHHAASGPLVSQLRAACRARPAGPAPAEQGPLRPPDRRGAAQRAVRLPGGGPVRRLGLAAVALAAATTATAQEEASLNRPGSGARAAGMGNAFIAVSDDGTAASWNPAGLSQLLKPEFSLVHSTSHRDRYLEGYRTLDQSAVYTTLATGTSTADIEFASAAVPFRLGGRPVTLQVGWRRLYQLATQVQGDSRRVAVSPTARAESTVRVDAATEGSINLWSLAGAVGLTNRLSVGWSLDFYRGQWDERADFNEDPGILGPTDFLSTVQSDRIGGHALNLGLLLAYPSVSVGFVYHGPLRGDVSETFSVRSSLIEPIDGSLPPSAELRFPQSLGAGVVWRPRPLVRLALDVTYNEWTQFLVDETGGSPDDAFSGFDGLPPELTATRDTVSLNAGMEKLFPAGGVFVPLRLGAAYEPQGGRDPLAARRPGLLRPCRRHRGQHEQLEVRCRPGVPVGLVSHLPEHQPRLPGGPRRGVRPPALTRGAGNPTIPAMAAQGLGDLPRHQHREADGLPEEGLRLLTAALARAQAPRDPLHSYSAHPYSEGASWGSARGGQVRHRERPLGEWHG